MDRVKRHERMPEFYISAHVEKVSKTDIFGKQLDQLMAVRVVNINKA